MDTDLDQYLYGDGSLEGRCGHCQRRVDNYDDLHRVTSIMRGGKGVECALRGDILPHEAAPLRKAANTDV